MKNFVFFLTLGFALSVCATDLEGVSAELRSVDKITGRTQTIEVPVGVATQMGNLQITLSRCLKKPPEETPENAAFLLIQEKNKEGDFDVVFNGWMFSSNPAISAMEHPVWDIWVLGCKVKQSSPSTAIKPETVQPVVTDTPVAVGDLEEI